MGLLSWLIKAVKDTTAMMLVVWMITAGIGLVGLHHCIVGTTEILAAVVAGGTVPFVEWLRFLLWATLGNAVGGVVFVALIKYSHATSES
jgi:formate-nitrite transporter family protein